MSGSHLLLLASIFLVAAIVCGMLVTEERFTGAERAARETTSSVFRALREFLADLLYLQLDRYHHMWMYQGNPWTTATDYLPQIWLVVHLDPHLTTAFADGAYHLSVNLERPEEGMRLLRLNPRDESLCWEYAFLMSELGAGTARERLEACLCLLRLDRETGGLEDPMMPKNTAILIAAVLERDSTSRRSASRFARRYDYLSDLMLYGRTGFNRPSS